MRALLFVGYFLIAHAPGLVFVALLVS